MKFKKILILFLIVAIFLAHFININAITYEYDSLLTNDSKSACLIEAKTGTVLYSKNEHDKLAPASMTKIMTMILVMEKLNKNLIKKNDLVTTPKEASSLGGSQIYLSEGEKMTVHDLLKAMCIASANDAAMSLAIYVGGNEKNFIKMMNDKAKELNLQNTNFENPYGFDNDNHFSSSYDMAMMARHLVMNYPDILSYTSIYEDYVREDTTKKFWLVNTNKLVKFMDGVDGLKTGWTEKSGYCLTATISKNNERFIAISMGNTSTTKRNQEVSNLLNYGLINYETKTIYEKDEIVKEISDVNYNSKKLVFKTIDEVVIVKNKNNELQKIKTIEHIDIENKNNYIDVYYNNKLYKRTYLKCDESQDKNSLFNLVFNIIKEILLISK